MIAGHATPETSKNHASGHLPMGYAALGDTGLTVSQAGFGCYRVSDAVPGHGQALEQALVAGINLIDTSANYTDGSSETMVGRVLGRLIDAGRLSREAVVVVSKVGYLQGQNLALSRQRRQEGREFPELVPYGQELEHCIHPEFIRDQLTRSRDRLDLETLDGYLLHNPEYYLSWAAKNGIPLSDARKEYYRRIRKAFAHLEKEVADGRIRFYGVSSNTFPAPGDDPAFTSLENVWDVARSITPNHHFRLVQMPLNTLETGAVVEPNQSDGRSVLDFAMAKNLGVLINRPLNAFFDNRLIRLADIPESPAKTENEIIACIRALKLSESKLWRRVLPPLALQPGLAERIKQQVAVSDGLKHYWRNFGSYEQWRQVRDTNFKPRVRGVLTFLEAHAREHPDLAGWMADHAGALEAAFEAAGSIYAEKAVSLLRRIRRDISNADPDWQPAGTLSQKAVRAVRSTAGISSVLVGMRDKIYVSDIIEEIQWPVDRKDRRAAWKTLQAATSRR